MSAHSDRILIRRNIRSLIGRSWSFGVLIAVAVALIVICDGVVGQTSRSVDQQLRQSSIMRTVEVSTFGVANPKPLNDGRIAEISRLPGVASVHPWLQAGCLITEPDVAVDSALWATPRMATGQPPIVASTQPEALPPTDDEAVLPSRVAGTDLRSLLGKQVTVEYTRQVTADSGEPVHKRLRIVGLYDETVGGRDGPSAIYLSERTVREMAAARSGVAAGAFGRQLGYPKLIVEAQRAESVAGLQRRLSEMGYNASSIQSQLDALPPAMSFLATLGRITTGALALMCLLAGLSIGAGLVRGRLRQIGLLKALGFTNARVARVLAGELGAFGALASAAGLLIGVAGLLVAEALLAGRQLFGVAMATSMTPPPVPESLLLWLTPALALLLGGAYPLWQAARIPPDAALRDR